MQQVRIGVVGFGKVVRAFLELLPEKAEYIRRRYGLDPVVVAICDRSESLLRYDGHVPEELLAHKLARLADQRGEADERTAASDIPAVVESFVQHEVQVVVEALPPSVADGEPALSYLSGFLSRRVAVVTVDKSPLVHGFPQLMALSRKTGAPLRFSGATASALPTTDVAALSLAGAGLYGFEGILNGTTNFLITEMCRNRSSVDEELAMAAEMGICEPDPALDIDGWDTAFKTLILARAFLDPRQSLGDIEVAGIRGLTFADLEPLQAQGATIRLLGKAGFEGDKVRLRVTPSIIPAVHPFRHVEGATKAITFFTDTMGPLTLIGGTSGLQETAATILKDVINLFRAPVTL